MSAMDHKTLEQEATEYRAEIERKQRQYLERRKLATKRESPTAPEAAAAYGIVGRNVDFDQPRNSPFEDKQPDQLFPQRKPPAPPSDPSATLIKANSLSRRPGHGLRNSSGSADGYPTPRHPQPQPQPQPHPQPHPHPHSHPHPHPHPAGSADGDAAEGKRAARFAAQSPSAVGGIGGLLVGMGRNLGAIGQSSASVPRGVSPSRAVSSSPAAGPDGAAAAQQPGKRSKAKAGSDAAAAAAAAAAGRPAGSPGSVTWSPGNLPFVVPDYSPGGTPLPAMPSVDGAAGAKRGPAVAQRPSSPGDVSPNSTHSRATASTEASSRRRPHGPDLDFGGDADVRFSTTPHRKRSGGLRPHPVGWVGYPVCKLTFQRLVSGRERARRGCSHLLIVAPKERVSALRSTATYA